MGPPLDTSDPPHGFSLGVGLEVPSALVVPLDGSDFAQRAVPVACRFAVAFDAEVVAVTTPQTIEEGAQLEPPTWLTALSADTPTADPHGGGRGR